MKVPIWVRKARFNPKLIKLAKIFYIHESLKKIYRNLTLPGNRKMEIKLFGYAANFYVNTTEELIMLETSLIDSREGELRVLEKILQILNQGDTAYDIGASIGTHAIFMAKKVGQKGKVIAFEPEANSYKKLNANIKLNSLNNIITIKTALGNHFSEGVIRGCSKDSLGHFTLLEDSNDNKYSQNVELVAGDVYIRDKQLPFPDIVKIDVEGYEYYVIQGLKDTLMQEKCRLVFCEIHSTMPPEVITSEDILSLLKSYGFNRVETYLRGNQIHAFCYKTKY